MENDTPSYTHRLIFDQRLARDVHMALGFGPNEKYRGKFFVEVRESEDRYTVSARSDNVMREFTMASGGMTILKETILATEPDRSNLEKMTIFSPDQGIEESVFPAGDIHKTMMGIPARRWLTGEEARNEIEWHASFSAGIRHLMNSAFHGGSPELKLEPEVTGIEAIPERRINIADFMKSFDGPA